MLPIGRFQLETASKSFAPIIEICTNVNLYHLSVQVTQTQRFSHNEPSPVKVLYAIELPDGCIVSYFKAEINDRIVETSVGGRNATRGSPLQVDFYSKDSNGFAVDIGSVEPRTEVFTTVKYEMRAEMVDDHIVLKVDPLKLDSLADHPLTFVDPKKDSCFNFNVDITTLTPILNIWSPSHDKSCFSVEGGLNSPHARVTLNQKGFLLNRSFVLAIQEEDPRRSKVVAQESKDHVMVLLSITPHFSKEIKCEMIAVIDHSGSMDGAPIEYAKKTLVTFLNRIPSQAIFNVIPFNSGFTPFSKSSVDTSHKQAAIGRVRSLDAGGGTNIYGPLKFIYDQPTKPGFPRQVFIITDGRVDNPDACVQLVNGNARNTRLFAFGIGSGVDVDLVKNMANAGNGCSVFVQDAAGIEKAVDEILEHALRPGANNIELTFTYKGTDKAVVPKPRVIPHHLPPVFEGSTVTAFVELPKDCPPVEAHLSSCSGSTAVCDEISSVIDPSQSTIEGDQIIKLGGRMMIQDIESGNGEISKDDLNGKEKVSMEYQVPSSSNPLVANSETSGIQQAPAATVSVIRSPEQQEVIGNILAPTDDHGVVYDVIRQQDTDGSISDDALVILDIPDEVKRVPGNLKVNFTPNKEKIEHAQRRKSLCELLSNINPNTPRMKRCKSHAITVLNSKNGNAAHLCNPEKIWNTMLVLLLLKKKYPDRKSQYSIFTSKAEKFLQDSLQNSFDTWKSAAEKALSK